MAVEQSAVDVAYRRLDQLRDRVAGQLRAVRRSRPSGSPQNRSERDAFATEYERRLAQLWAVEDRLVFGRLDLVAGEVRRIGRIGLSDEEQRQLVVDWRAEAASDFYRATGANPGPVVRRRHIGMRGRTVVGVEDEVLDVEQAAHADRGDRSLVLTGEGALMAALAEHRTGHMRDIVSTIQGEQDAVIRAPMEGVLVVQGGPGTGKTAVALHRAAYLLYHHRDRLARTGVLVVGPNPLFLRYIDQVLPSLGETAVVLATVGDLGPDVEVAGADPPPVAAIKGDLRMAAVLRRAVAARQRVPARDLELDVDGATVLLRPAAVSHARDLARRSGQPHNRARDVFVRHVLDDLVGQLADRLGVSLDDSSRAELLADLRESPDVRREVNLCWMPLTPEGLVQALLTEPARLAEAGGGLTAEECRLLLREPAARWTVDDVPLLDEAADRLGDDDSVARAESRRRAAERAAEVRYARQVLETGAGGGLVSADRLADRFAEKESVGTVAERAAVDRGWTYGHVVVDEAQELSPMAWRALLRRCPSRSMTVVGDTAQTSSPAGAGSWAEALDRLVPGRWRLAELTVNYRTPAPVMALAAGVLAAGGGTARPPRAARSGLPPTFTTVDRIDVDTVERVVVGELEVLGAGRLAVITPSGGHSELAQQLRRRMTPPSGGPGGSSLDEQVVVLDVTTVKGLEFDSVVLVEPADVLAQSLRGMGDLYVALTRCTQRLTVVHARPLPESMDSLVDAPAAPG